MPRPRARLEQLELHLWPRGGDGASLDLCVASSTPRADVGAPLVDVGLLAMDAGEPVSAQATRVDAAPIALVIGPGSIRGAFAPAEVAVALRVAPIYRRPGLLFGDAQGEVHAFGRAHAFAAARVLLLERSGSKRPYAWARVTLRGELDGEPLLCVVETARRRAGSVVLPELGRLRLLGAATRRLPRACALSPLPLKAEYGTGRLRATAIGPGVRAELELDAPPSATALFEVVDPSGEAAYAHRALGASARLRLRTRRGDVTEIALDGRYEWGARAGDPRVTLRAWRPGRSI